MTLRMREMAASLQMRKRLLMNFLKSLESIVQSVSVSTTSATSCAFPSFIKRRMNSSLSSTNWMMTNQPMPSWRVLFSRMNSSISTAWL